MKTNTTQKESTKKVYVSPLLEKISIDNEVSLVMASTPPAPGGAPGGSAWGE